MSDKEKTKEKKTISQEDVMKLLDSCYDKCLNGVPKVSQSVEDMAEDYLKKYQTKEESCKAMLKNQIAKCTTSGFITWWYHYYACYTSSKCGKRNVCADAYDSLRCIYGRIRVK